MRARYPDTEGFVERDGVKVAYEVFGSGEPTLVFAPTDPLVHSRAWKAQVPYLARTSRVVTIDPRGNGRSDRPESSAAYADTEFVADTIAVMDAAGVDRAVLVGMCSSAWTTLLAAALHPDRVLGIVNIATWVPFLTPPRPGARSTTSTPIPGPTKAGPGTPGITGCGTGAGSPSSSSPSCCPSRTPASSTRTAWAGSWRPAPRRTCCSGTRRSRRPAVRRPRRSWPG